MPKKQKNIDPQCDQHLLILKPKNNFCRFGQLTTVSFCQQLKDKNKSKIKKCRNTQCLDCPIYNKDRNFTTPTFILKSEKQYFEERGFKFREQHQKKMIQYTDEKDSLNVPKPRTKNNFCSVCRQVYEDYLEHIQSQKHKKKINGSTFNKYILDIAQKFNPNLKNHFNCSHHTLSTKDQEDVEILESKPKKKIKSENQVSQRFPSFQEFMRQPIAPPPHLNLSNNAYFPRFASEMGMIPSPVHQMPPPAAQMNHQQMTFNYNMNIFMNPYNYPAMSHYPYGFMNPWFGCNPVHRPQNSPYSGMDPNLFLTENYHENYEKRIQQALNINAPEFEEKKEITHLYKPEVIVIDDNEDEENMMDQSNGKKVKPTRKQEMI